MIEGEYDEEEEDDEMDGVAEILREVRVNGQPVAFHHLTQDLVRTITGVGKRRYIAIAQQVYARTYG